MLLLKRFIFLSCIFIIPLLGTVKAMPSPVAIEPIGEVSPQNGQVLFKWQSVPNIDYYELGAYPLDTQGEIVWNPILDLAVMPQQAGCKNGGDCQVLQSVDSLTAIWKLRSISLEGEKSDYTDYIPFSVNAGGSTGIPDFSTPSIMSPRSSVTKINGLVEFSWQAVSNVSIYELGAYPIDSQGSIIWDSLLDTGVTPQQAACENGGICRFFYNLPVDEATWKIRAISPQGLKSNYSEYTDFHITTISDMYPPFFFPSAVNYTNWEDIPDDLIEKPETQISAPSFLSSMLDIETGKKVWRLGGSPSEMNSVLPHPNGEDAITNLHAQHFYSRTTPSNADESYALSASENGYAALWKLSNKQLVAWIPTDSISNVQQRQLLWDKKFSNVFWYTSGNKLKRANIDFDTYLVSTEIWDNFPNFQSISFGLGEGDFSDDGEKVVIVGKDLNGNNDYTIIAYQVSQKSSVASKQIPEGNGDILDWAGVDPTGEYIIFNDPSLDSNSMWVLPFDLTGTPRLLYKHMKHSDFVVDQNGDPWLVFGHWQGIFATKLSSSLWKRVWPTAIDIGDPALSEDKAIIDPPNNIVKTASGHISRVSGLPGVILMARNIDGGLYYINIDEPEKTVYVGNTRHGRRPKNDNKPKQDWGVDVDGGTVDANGGKAYKREPKASASQSGKYIFFVSDYHTYGTNYASNPAPAFVAFLNLIDLEGL